jgi:DNA invertase Pin-like site-specific DNA recombinase
MELEYFNKFSSFKKDEVNNNEVLNYTRVSSKEQFKNNNSVSTQETALKKYAEVNNYQIIDTFGGTYESASGDFSRKEFKRLIDRVKQSKKKPFAIMIFKMSRFSRTGGNAIGLVNELIHDMGVHIIEVSTGKNTTTDRGEHEIFESLLYARKENIERGEVTMPGLIRFIEQGDWLGVVPRGYDHFGTRVTRSQYVTGKQKIVINNEGELLKKAWKWKLQGDADFTIIEKLSVMGLVLSKQFISAMWRKPFYCGISTHKYLQGKSIKGNWEGLVSVTDFQKINESLDSKSNNGYEQSKFHEGRPLQSLLYCGVCGTKITGYKAKKLYDYYKCNNNNCETKDMNAINSSKSKGLNDIFVEYLSQYELKANHVEAFKEQIKLTIRSLEKDSYDERIVLTDMKKSLVEKLEKLERKYAFDDLDGGIYKKYKKEMDQV